jgi:tRNA A-37 threonylcarbamoyl transferase component Bud32
MYKNIENFPTELSDLQAILEAEARRNDRVKILRVFEERLFVECDEQVYLFIISVASADITPGVLEKKVETWSHFEKRIVSGHILIAPFANVSSTIAASRGGLLPLNVAVVGGTRWDSVYYLTIGLIDSQMEYLFEVLGVPEIRNSRVIKKTDLLTELAHKTNPLSTNSLTSDSLRRVDRQLRKDMLLDAYHLEKRLGRGFSAEVWKAQVASEIPGVELEIGDTVAIKIYSLNRLHGSQSIRVQREFDLATGTDHKRLARVYDLVISPSRPFHTFLVMECVEGPTLKEYISQVGKLSYLQTAVIGVQVFEALVELHALGAIHRDVKAANIMLSNTQEDNLEAKLVDLGIVSVIEDNQLTAASVFMGSKHSSPLEQLSGKEIDDRTDIYGAGSVLYHCLRGSAMYEGAGPEGAIVMRMISSPASLPATSTATKAELELIQFVNSCIEVEMSKRPISAEDCLETLTKIRNKLRKN